MRLHRPRRSAPRVGPAMGERRRDGDGKRERERERERERAWSAQPPRPVCLRLFVSSSLRLSVPCPPELYAPPHAPHLPRHRHLRGRADDRVPLRRVHQRRPEGPADPAVGDAQLRG
ncbi:hypothetical protein PSMK_11900 [Phycisphaera mikurensis NBRC 102666]|uniref:Uncharacterized protein n=1 Tax=Phycisphaera mikurensis (strain NBRC 102666 / KCTC 22515 / FYK2301M01) TaxID=1142394 RepID=I0IDL1_PHYMF|nr:hypothetical protein PSMK_11900 [Phycisphaera mikurensis NBRC 102666]